MRTLGANTGEWRMAMDRRMPENIWMAIEDLEDIEKDTINNWRMLKCSDVIEASSTEHNY